MLILVAMPLFGVGALTAHSLLVRLLLSLLKLQRWQVIEVIQKLSLLK